MRIKAIESLPKNSPIPAIEFAYVKPGVVYDHLIVINGCLSRCADITQIQVSGDTYKIADENQLDELVTQLRLK